MRNFDNIWKHNHMLVQRLNATSKCQHEILTTFQHSTCNFKSLTLAGKSECHVPYTSRITGRITVEMPCILLHVWPL